MAEYAEVFIFSIREIFKFVSGTDVRPDVHDIDKAAQAGLDNETVWKLHTLYKAKLRLHLPCMI